MRSAIAIAVAAVLPACTGTQPPRITLADAAVSDRSGEALVIDFTLDAENINDEPLPLATVDYTVRLDGRVVFRGTRSAQATLRRRGTQQIVLPAAVRADLTRPGLSQTGESGYRITGVLRYITPGEISRLLFDAGLRRPSARFDAEGVIDLADPADPVALQPPQR
jgi:hypothetical protein